ncbi:MAG TPA: serine hydrolase domain-containing protein [Acidimicrobiia bacterium]|nr:serine hydrolase domain-containing protein [Acidimicrobiia bacterium]
MVDICGRLASGYELVREAFAENFRSRGEVGAAVAVVVGNELVVDLWGGMANPRQNRPWAEDTLVTMFSTTKGMSGLATAHAHSRGLFDYDEKVSTYWPEFAQNGKEEITVRTLLSHQAGLCAIDEPLDLDTLADPDAMAGAIAKQSPAWEPGRKHGYHGITLGWYESELIRRTDPRRRTIGRYFADEIAAPLGLEFYIGLPDHIPDERVARIMADWYRLKMILRIRTLPPEYVKGLLNPRSITARTFANPKVLAQPIRNNDRALLKVELPSHNGTGTVRSVALAYGEFGSGGKRLGIDAATLAALSQPATAPTDGFFDQVMRIDLAYSLGFGKQIPGRESGFPRAFGHGGAGGSFGAAVPELEMGYCYAMNRLGFHLLDDPREAALREAAAEAAKTRLS